MENNFNGLWGKKRTDYECSSIFLLSVSGIEYGVSGYVDSLRYYQGNESIFKAERLAKRMTKDKGEKLIAFVKKSNKRMEEEYLAAIGQQ